MDLITLALCQNMIEEIDKGAKIQVVSALPQIGETNTIYLVPKQETGINDVFDEYIYTNNAWEQIGTTNIDLTDYVQKTDYATTQTAGVFKSNSNFGTQINNSGYLTGASKSYEDWGNLHPDCFITRYTLDNYVNGAGLLTNNDIATVATSGDYNDLTGKPDLSLMNDVIEIEGPVTYTNLWQIRYNKTVGVLHRIKNTSSINGNNVVFQLNNDYSITIPYDGSIVYMIYPHERISSEYITLKDTIYFFLPDKILKVITKFENGFPVADTVEEIKSYDVLEKNNTTAYTPVNDYNPATKKYVDDAINASITTVLGGSY